MAFGKWRDEQTHHQKSHCDGRYRFLISLFCFLPAHRDQLSEKGRIFVSSKTASP